MILEARSIGALVLRLLVGLVLLGWPRVGAAQGMWSVISLPPPQTGEAFRSSALAVDAAGNLYVAEYSRIQKRDAQGNWSEIATRGTALGQVKGPLALAVDRAGNLYVAEHLYFGDSNHRIQKRDAQGNWTVVATNGTALGQVDRPTALAVDSAGNLYVADHRIQKRDAQGNWTVIATQGTALGQLGYAGVTGGVLVGTRLAVDTAGNLYVAEYFNGRIQKRDAQGNWSWVVPQGALALAADPRGNLYAAVYGAIWKRDARGNWSVIATEGSTLGELKPRGWSVIDLAVDSAGNLYVADIDNDNYRVQVYTPHP
jgi:DNA-binding beta-propeller fold protein YncE